MLTSPHQYVAAIRACRSSSSPASAPSDGRGGDIFRCISSCSDWRRRRNGGTWRHSACPAPAAWNGGNLDRLPAYNNAVPRGITLSRPPSGRGAVERSPAAILMGVAAVSRRPLLYIFSIFCSTWKRSGTCTVERCGAGAFSCRWRGVPLSNNMWHSERAPLCVRSAFGGANGAGRSQQLASASDDGARKSVFAFSAAANIVELWENVSLCLHSNIRRAVCRRLYSGWPSLAYLNVIAAGTACAVSLGGKEGVYGLGSLLLLRWRENDAICSCVL